MNHKEHLLGELELHHSHAREALRCVLHSVIFLRAPNSVRPKEVHCDSLRLSFAKCDQPPSRLDESIDAAIDACLSSLAPAGPDLRKGRLTLTFYEKRRTQTFWGLVHSEEKVVFEEWVLPLLVDVTPIPAGDDGARVVERSRVQERCESLVRQRLMDIFSLINGSMDHIPPVTYQFELSCGNKRDRGQDLGTKLRNSPGLITPL